MVNRQPCILTCCIGTNELALQGGHRSNGDPSLMRTRRSDAVLTTASALEYAICSRLAYHQDEAACDAVNGHAADVDEGELRDPVQIFASDDAHLLRCRALLHDEDGGERLPTIFGIIESATYLRSPQDRDEEIQVRLTLWEPRFCQQKRQIKSKGCACHHPRGNWTRKRTGTSSGGDMSYPKQAIDSGTRNFPSYHANIKTVDLTKIQGLRRNAARTDGLYPCFDTPGKVFHLLRSILNNCDGGLHHASPWNERYCNENIACSNDGATGGADEDCGADQVVALLVKDPNRRRGNKMRYADDRFWEGIEQREVSELVNFRTGDAAPSYYLHSTSRLLGGQKILFDIFADLRESTCTINRKQRIGGSSSPSPSDALLFVYRRLPPRKILSHRHFGHEEYAGCLWETYLEDAAETKLDTGLELSQTQPVVVKHRLVSPPYQLHAQEYPGLLDPLLKGINSIREEARKIPKWAAWPEEKHYADNSWSVFPLCYTFPAGDISRRKFIHKTCSLVPETTKLVRSLGPSLRTALFSRLDPRARLGAHTGWSDLANHVLRLHVPLLVPGGRHNAGLCGMWVDGCVETHREGQVVCFDDSKVHRAFNYSEEERVVLIVDLLRPKDLPMGTANGGHTAELDAFIDKF